MGNEFRRWRRRIAVRARIRTTMVMVLLFTGGAVVGAYDITTVDLGRGPVNVHVPDGYQSDTPTPLILLLHGYNLSGIQVEQYLRFRQLVDQEGFILLFPDGTRDGRTARFWNATRACCDFDESQVDDSGYLRALINELTTIFSIDPDRVFVVGHSNGGFMAYRMACDHSDVVTGIASFAGAAYLDPDDCRPEHPVHVLQIHGTDDTGVRYEGGCLPEATSCYPSAEASVEQWIVHNHCSSVVDDSVPPLDLVPGIQGAETAIRRYRAGCSVGGSCQLWTIDGGNHTPVLTSEFSRIVVDHFFALEARIPAPPRMRRPIRRHVPRSRGPKDIVTLGGGE